MTERIVAAFLPLADCAVVVAAVSRTSPTSVERVFRADPYREPALTCSAFARAVLRDGAPARHSSTPMGSPERQENLSSFKHLNTNT